MKRSNQIRLGFGLFFLSLFLPSISRAESTIKNNFTSEILRLCRQSCEFVLPTQADLDAIQKDAVAHEVIQDFSVAISQGVTPREAALLAAIDPNNTVLASSIPEIATRLNQISRINPSFDPTANISGLQNPMIGFRQVLTVGVGADGRPTYSVTSRSSQFGDPIRAGLSFISEGPNREIDMNKGAEDAEARTRIENEISIIEEASKGNLGAREETIVSAPPESRYFVARLAHSINNFFNRISDAFSSTPRVVRPDGTDLAPDAVDLGGPQISTQEIIDSHRPSVIDPADEIQNQNLSNFIPRGGNVVDPHRDQTFGTGVISVTRVINAKTINGKITPNDPGSGLNTGIFVEGKSTLQSDTCNALGNCD